VLPWTRRLLGAGADAGRRVGPDAVGAAEGELAPGAGAPAPRRPAPSAARRRLAALGLLAFCCLLAEGAAADWSAVYADPALAAATTTGYVGFLAGPPLIGGLAELISLPVALGLLPLLAAVMVVLSGAVAPAGPALTAPAGRLEPAAARR